LLVLIHAKFLIKNFIREVSLIVSLLLEMRNKEKNSPFLLVVPIREKEIEKAPSGGEGGFTYNRGTLVYD
jgi:hypothetical protein